MSDREDLTRAVGRAWCHPETSHLTIDTELSEAIIDEVLPLLIRARYGDPALALMDGLRRGHTIDIVTEAGERVATIDTDGRPR